MRSRCSAGRHRGGPVQRIGRLFDVVRIDDQRFGQLACGAGEAAEDQHAVLVVARGDELLAHQVHAVVQAGDHADVGGAEQLVDRIVLVMLGQQVDRLVVRGLPKRLLMRSVARCDAFVEAAGIPRARLRVGAATCTNTNLPTHCGYFSSRPLDRVQPLEDALGVVEPVDADREAGVGRQAEALEHARAALGDRRPRGRSACVGPLDRDRDSSRPASRCPRTRWSSVRARCAPRGNGRRSR